MEAPVIKASSDPQLIARLNQHAHDWHHQTYPQLFKPYDFQSTHVFFSDLLARPETFCFVIHDGEKPVGYIVAIERNTPESAFKHAAHTLYIDQVAIDPQYRNQGLGQQLINRVLEKGRELGVQRVELDHWAANIGARRFFERHGFKPANHRLSHEF